MFLGFPAGSAGKESACSAAKLGPILGLRRSPGERNGYPLHYSGLYNSMNCIVHGVAKSRMWLSHFSTRFWGFLRGTSSKETAFQCRRNAGLILGSERPLEEGMTTHSSILAWRIPWTEEPGRVQAMGSQESDMTEWLSTHSDNKMLRTWAHFIIYKIPCHVDCSRWEVLWSKGLW